MSKFVEGLKNGRFLAGSCTRCNRTVWPPSEFCDNCFGGLQWREVTEPGVLIELSAKDGKAFGIVEFEGTIRVIGTISNPDGATPGSGVRILKCGFDKTPQFTFSLT